MLLFLKHLIIKQQINIIEDNMFKNRPNKLVRVESGRHHWISRSVAVVAVVFWNNKTLIIKRGPSVTATGKWCVPCGYLDWDESTADCAVREVYEESGLNLNNYKYSGLDAPYEVVSDPTINRKQDVAFHYKIVIDSDIEPLIDITITDKLETLDAKWIDISDLSLYQFAFNHDTRILKVK